MAEKPITYHIIGGGIAGLSCAKLIKERKPSIRAIVYEAGEHAGGRCYSYDDADLGVRLDNATHVVIGANKHMRKLMGPQNWHDDCWFWDVSKDEVSCQYRNYKDLILKSMCNTPAEKIAPEIIKKIIYKTFPWSKKQRRICFSGHDLTQKLINPLTTYADEVVLNCKLIKIDSQFGKIAQLTFSNHQVEIGADDVVILALSSRAYQHLRGGAEFDYNSIINIFYHTSQQITLPKHARFLGIHNGSADWVFVNNNIVGVTISAAAQDEQNLEEVARKVWKELDNVRGVNSAFVPSFKVFNHKMATISQDGVNNAKRPDSAETEFPNLFIAGDWTMKDHPCCMETAVLSAQRAIKTSLKKK